MSIKTLAVATMVTMSTLGISTVSASEKLVLVCSAQQSWCELMAKTFERQTGIDTAMIRKSTGETLSQIRAESENPKIDVWWGGTGDPHLQAAEENLTATNNRDNSELLGWARNVAEISKNKTVGIYAGALGIGYNSELLKEKGLPAPKCWADLTKPVYKGEIQIANPNSSGTSYTALATLVQIFGEDEAFKMLKGIGKNVNQYTKSGSAPIKAAARGETTIGITFMHDMVKQAKAGFPIKIVAPCEGTGYEIGSVSIIKGARNLKNAKKWVDFALDPKIQSLAGSVGAYQVPSNSNAIVPPESPDLNKIKLIDYDFSTFGSSKTRKRLLKRWDVEVKS